jgi:phosphotriesterase-related protein
VCCKIRLERYGGEGYGHILRHVVPLMLRKGLGRAEVDRILVENPARMLAGAMP